jgi:hypothetical protein
MLTCRGGSPWPPLLFGMTFRFGKRGGHGGPPVQVFIGLTYRNQVVSFLVTGNAKDWRKYD